MGEYHGPDADQDGSGPIYANWDAEVTQMCVCDRGCGFKGSYDEVARHEESCDFAGEEPEGDIDEDRLRREARGGVRGTLPRRASGGGREASNLSHKHLWSNFEQK